MPYHKRKQTYPAREVLVDTLCVKSVLPAGNLIKCVKEMATTFVWEWSFFICL